MEYIFLFPVIMLAFFRRKFKLIDFFLMFVPVYLRENEGFREVFPCGTGTASDAEEHTEIIPAAV